MHNQPAEPITTFVHREVTSWICNGRQRIIIIITPTKTTVNKS